MQFLDACIISAAIVAVLALIMAGFGLLTIKRAQGPKAAPAPTRREVDRRKVVR